MSVIEPHLWWILALACSLFTAMYFTINQYYKISGFTLVFWRGVIPLLVLSPVVYMMDWPTLPLFYIATIITSLIVTYTDARQLQGAALFGGGASSRTKPFTVWLVFIVWFIVDAGQRAELISDVPRLCGILLALLVGVIAASKLSKCMVSRQAIIYFMPLIVTGAVTDILNKTAMLNSSFWQGIIFYSWIQALVITVLSCLLHTTNKSMSVKSLFEKKTMILGSAIGVVMVALTLSKNMAMTYTTNPAYVTAVIFLAPIWITLYYKATGQEEEADVRSGLMFLLSAILLVLLNS